MNCFGVPQNNAKKIRAGIVFRAAGGGRADRRPPIEDTALIFTSCRHRQSIKTIWEYQVVATTPLHTHTQSELTLRCSRILTARSKPSEAAAMMLLVFYVYYYRLNANIFILPHTHTPHARTHTHARARDSVPASSLFNLHVGRVQVVLY